MSASSFMPSAFRPKTSATPTSQTTQSRLHLRRICGTAPTSDTFNIGVTRFAFIAQKHNIGFGWLNLWHRLATFLHQTRFHSRLSRQCYATALMR